MNIVCVQSDVVFGDPYANVAVAIGKLREHSEADLLLLPEAFLTGYCVDSREAAAAIAIPSDHAVFGQLQEAVDVFGGVVVIGFAEASGAVIYNTAAILEANEPIRFYRKTHLPFLGLDRFVTTGDELPVFETHVGRLGVLICYDVRFPEPARSLALAGAEIIVVPTNWPEGAEISADVIALARAAENRVFLASCNRVGTENGFTFIGRSKIIPPSGRPLVEANECAEVISATLDLREARQKRIVNIPGKYETDTFGARRPELYGEIGKVT